jgi:hypothetical protein
MELTLFEEKQLRIESARMGAQIALSKLGLIKDEISQREAYRIFGESNVRSWKNEGLIKRIKIGENNSKSTYSLIELETIMNLKENRKLKSK